MELEHLLRRSTASKPANECCAQLRRSKQRLHHTSLKLTSLPRGQHPLPVAPAATGWEDSVSPCRKLPYISTPYHTNALAASTKRPPTSVSHPTFSLPHRHLPQFLTPTHLLSINTTLYRNIHSHNHNHNHNHNHISQSSISAHRNRAYTYTHTHAHTQKYRL